MVKAEIDIVNRIGVPFELISLLSLTLSVTIVVQSQHLIPGSCNDVVLVCSPVDQTGDIFFFFITNFLWLFELLHFDTILHVDAVDTTTLITDEEFPLSLVKADASNVFR